MNTNQFWNTENIKALAALWPLALICFLIPKIYCSIQHMLVLMLICRNWLFCIMKS